MIILIIIGVIVLAGMFNPWTGLFNSHYSVNKKTKGR